MGLSVLTACASPHTPPDHAAALCLRPPATNTPWNQALANAGLPTEAWQLPDANPFPNPGSVPGPNCLDALMREPLQAPAWLDGLALAMRQATAHPGNGQPILAPLFELQACASGLAIVCARRCPRELHSASALAFTEQAMAGLDHPALRAILADLLPALFTAHQPWQSRAQDSTLALRWLGLLPTSAHEAHDAQPDSSHALHALLRQTDFDAMACGAMALAQAVETAVRRLQSLQAAGALPPLRWHADTALGRIVLDTMGDDRHHVVDEQLLLIDIGGNDHYRFTERSRQRPVAVLLELGGDDHYLSTAHATGPAVAVHGYHLHWDSAGNDHYAGGAHGMAQAAALLGVAMLVDEAGDDVYEAASHAQAWAMGGMALLLDRQGHDRYHALSMAQASALPLGAALLVDAAGDDRYTLAAQPLLQPSAQLPERNLSMGQGAAMGQRAQGEDGAALPGGMAILFDRAGDDHYQAQVFAQGAGYFQGTGVLIDGDGHDRFDAAWYAMGAAAHRGAGLLLAQGHGDDRYTASHVTSLGAAHDQSLAVFIDAGGHDRYALADLGLGASSDNSVALFIERAGADRYAISPGLCRAFGAAVLSARDTDRLDIPGLGLFWDQAGNNRYPDMHCASPAHGQHWRWSPSNDGDAPRISETGLGIDGALPAPIEQ